MAKKQAPLGSKEMADLLSPLAEILKLYIGAVLRVPNASAQQRGELRELHRNLYNSLLALNNLVDMDDRTWEVEKVAIHE